MLLFSYFLILCHTAFFPNFIQFSFYHFTLLFGSRFGNVAYRTIISFQFQNYYSTDSISLHRPIKMVFFFPMHRSFSLTMYLYVILCTLFPYKVRFMILSFSACVVKGYFTIFILFIFLDPIFILFIEKMRQFHICLFFFPTKIFDYLEANLKNWWRKKD